MRGKEREKLPECRVATTQVVACMRSPKWLRLEVAAFSVNMPRVAAPPSANGARRMKAMPGCSVASISAALERTRRSRQDSSQTIVHTGARHAPDQQSHGMHVIKNVTRKQWRTTLPRSCTLRKRMLAVPSFFPSRFAVPISCDSGRGKIF